MSLTSNVDSLGGAGGMGGFGGGGGILEGILLGAVLPRLFNDNNDGRNGGDVTLQNSIDTNAILQSLGDIKASVPLAEAQVQLALAGQAASVTGAIAAAENILQTQGVTSQLANLQGFSNVKDAVNTLSTQVAIGQGVTNTNIERLGWQLSKEITSDGAATRALITAQEQATLNRIIVTQASELAELRNESSRERDRHGIEITMTNNQNNNQLQFQQQQQVLATLANCIADVSQVARATNQQLIIGNTGSTSGGAQSANPTNVRA
jgi:hypothetical protein